MTQSPTETYRVLFVCRHNSCRSQMAEGFDRWLKNNNCSSCVFASVESAALEAVRDVVPGAVKVMNAIGVDISAFRSKMISQFCAGDFDVVISLCGCTAQVPDEWRIGKRFEDWNVADPTGLADEDFVLCRDEIVFRVKELETSLLEGRKPTYTLYNDSTSCAPR